MVAILLENFEERVVDTGKVRMDGAKVTEIVARYRKGQKFPVIENFSLFWMTDEEKGGMAVDLGPMDYVRLTYPNGEKTKHHALFEIKDENN